MTAHEDRRLRADAERNRRRLLAVAADLFRERGLEVGVAEIARQAGVGRGTLFRNFATKEDLIAAVVVDGMGEAAARGRTLLGSTDAAAALFEFLDYIAGRQRSDRALFEAVADTFLANEEIRAAHIEVVSVLEDLLTNAKQAGAVREDVGSGDVLLLLKGVCEVAGAYAHLDPGVVGRQLDLVRCALSAPAAGQVLRGRTLTVADLSPPSTPAPRPNAAAG